jgi:DNA-directed RNA polymerase sigma subunit (sigma70/sigma32)
MNKNDAALSSYLRELGVTRERVRQLEAAALGKLRRAFKKHLVRSKQSFSPPRKATPQKNLKSCEM